MILFHLNHAVVILLAIKYLCCQRRIHGGEKLTTIKSYLVYFVHSEQSTTNYDGWTCAGALVHSLYVVTAAACIEDVPYLYVVAGYLKFIPYEELDTDECTKTYRKKVIYTCVPKAYEFDYGNVEKWAAIDIGIAKVDAPFRQREEYEKICTHRPLRIPINYDPKYQMPGLDAIVMGWGHLEDWRKPGDDEVYIQDQARYASTRIMNKRECKEYYGDFPDLQRNIDKYMICTMDRGRINSDGVMEWSPDEFLEECTEEEQNCRRNFRSSSLRNFSDVNITYNLNARRQGICQNDHGGPLVTWIGGKEHLIGVASVFRVNKEGKCAGPYLFTSTQCNGAFLNCVLEPDMNGHRRSSICDLPAKERGFEMIHKYISWPNHTHIKKVSRKQKEEKFKQVTLRTAKIPVLNEEVPIRSQISIRNV